VLEIVYYGQRLIYFCSDKHSAFSTSFPIYLFTQKNETVPDEDATDPPEKEEAPPVPVDELEDDEAVVEEIPKHDDTKEKPPPKTKQITVEEWSHLNARPPLWQRYLPLLFVAVLSSDHSFSDPKTISDHDYKLFYQSTFKDFSDPLAWHHFSGDSGTGTSFRAIIFIPSYMYVSPLSRNESTKIDGLSSDDSFWSQHEAFKGLDIRLMVKRVFITNNLGEDAMPRWASWIKAVVDGKPLLSSSDFFCQSFHASADDLPLNVSRETLQSTRFLKQIRAAIIKHLISLKSR
jgi:heat shock protein 90kDa beta